MVSASPSNPKQTALTPAPPALTVKLLNSAPLHMSLALFKLLPKC